MMPKTTSVPMMSVCMMNEKSRQLYSSDESTSPSVEFNELFSCSAIVVTRYPLSFMSNCSEERRQTRARAYDERVKRSGEAMCYRSSTMANSGWSV